MTIPSAVAGGFQGLCTHGCRWNPKGSWQEVVPACRAHEATTSHRVHLSNADRASLWPRDMWTAADEVKDLMHDDLCEAEFITGPMAWSPCACALRRPDRS